MNFYGRDVKLKIVRTDEFTLTPEECANQFRNYANCLESHRVEEKHQLNLAASFLDKFCMKIEEDVSI